MSYMKHIAQLIQEIEEYKFTCEAGTLKCCEEWIELKKLLSGEK